jgi:YXWGXW repeat-containing protein
MEVIMKNHRTKKWLVALGLAAGLLAGCLVRGHGAYVVAVAPPAPRATVVVEPRPGYLWIEGHWAWVDDRWTWLDGYWEAERPGYVWVQGYWEPRGGRYHWIDGHWSARVGASRGHGPDRY